MQRTAMSACRPALSAAAPSLARDLTWLLLVLTTLATAPWRAAMAEPSLVSDISSHRIGITSSYTGTELLLFGALGEAGDVVVVVSGPGETVTVRQKEQVAGIWINTRAITFNDVPGFYAVAANRPLTELADRRILRRNGIGIDFLRFGETDVSDREGQFAEAIRRRRLENGLYRELPEGVTVIYDKLFRASIPFPANVPVGNYNAQIFLMQDGQVVAAESKPIIIDKSGMERAVYLFAHRLPALYGIAAVIVACLAGWGAAQAFRGR